MQVFVSHSSQDKPLARRICGELQSRGIKVWLDEAEIRVGESIPEQIGKAILESDVCCILISRAAASSHWVNRELNAFVPHMLSKGGVILPCKLDESPCPPLIADIKYADFGRSFDYGLEELLRAVRVREAVLENDRLQRLKSELVNSLTKGELLFFVHRFQCSEHFLVGDFTEERVPSAVLSKLTDCDALEYYADKHELLWRITPLGERLLDLVSCLVSETELLALDKGEGPRDPKRIRRGAS